MIMLALTAREHNVSLTLDLPTDGVIIKFINEFEQYAKTGYIKGDHPQNG